MAYVRVRRPPEQQPTIGRGCDLFRAFHRYTADRVVRTPARRAIPEVLVRLGRLKAVIYTSDKGERGCKPRTYIHFMETQPWLTCDAVGRQLYVIGGRYQVTDRGIEG